MTRGREPWLEVGAVCGSRTGEQHLIESSTQIATWRSGDGVVRQCKECHRRHARQRKAAKAAGFASVVAYRADLARLEDEARKEAMLAEAMLAWKRRVRPNDVR